jgi:hypothetical protein
MKIPKLLLVGGIGLVAYYLLAKSSTPQVEAGSINTAPADDPITQLTNYIVSPDKIWSVSGSGKYIEAPTYIPSSGYTTTYQPSGQEIYTTIPSIASAGTDPLLKVTTTTGGSQHLTFTGGAATGTAENTAARQANMLSIAAIKAAQGDTSFINTLSYRQVMAL